MGLHIRAQSSAKEDLVQAAWDLVVVGIFKLCYY